MAIIVAHPDTQHSVHAAIGLKRAGLLRFLFTGFSLKRNRLLGGALKALQPAQYRRLEQHRRHAGLSAEEIRTWPGRLVAMRAGPWAYQKSQELFSNKAGRLGAREGCGVMAFNSAAGGAFRILKDRGLPCVLDQSIAHGRFSQRIGEGECETHGAWGDRWYPSPDRLAREDEEQELADLILCGSDFCVETMASQGVSRAKLRTVEYGADTSVFRPTGTPPTPQGTSIRLLFVGALTLRKGIHHLLEAAMRLRALGIRVTAAGLRQVRPEMLARYESVLQPVGFRLHEDMPELYRQHDVYVFPSLVEGSSLSIYEALASGLPVVTTANAGSIVRDGVEGLLVPPRDVDALTAAIERLATNPELRRAMGSAARERATTYGDWSHYGRRLAAAVGDFLERRPAAAGASR